tara:strand:+ start:557 stop:1678 length:1122 start_codon:yes stop_codon:yes gene_type:complete
MKRYIFTHLIALVLGGLVTVILSGQLYHNASEKVVEGSAVESKVRPKEKQSILPEQRVDDKKDSLIQVSKKEPEKILTPKDHIYEKMIGEIPKDEILEWLDKRNGNSEANAMVGILLEDPELFRNAIKLDPNNPYIHYLAANFSEFSDAEKLHHSERFYSLESDNSYAAMSYLVQLLNAGRNDTAIEVLEEITHRENYEDYRFQTALLRQEALIASGIHPVAAKIRGFLVPSGMNSGELFESVRQLSEIMPSLEENKRSSIAKLSANAVLHFRENSAESLIDHVYLLKAEREVIEKINDESFPLYDGLSNEEARNTILSEYEKVEKLAKKLAKVNVPLLKNPVIYSQYIDRRMLFGMENAIDWALKNLEIKEE